MLHSTLGGCITFRFIPKVVEIENVFYEKGGGPDLPSPIYPNGLQQAVHSADHSQYQLCWPRARSSRRSSSQELPSAAPRKWCRAVPLRAAGNLNARLDTHSHTAPQALHPMTVPMSSLRGTQDFRHVLLPAYTYHTSPPLD